MLTIFHNVKVLTPFVQRDACVIVREGKIQAVCNHFTAKEGDRVIDGKGLYLSPGFIDLHVHGGGGRSFMQAVPETIVHIGDAHAAYGTTSILPTTFSMPVGRLTASAEAIAAAMQSGRCRANILGVHFEGPCLSMKQSGAQSPDALINPDDERVEALLDHLPIMRMMGVAPELPGAFALGDRLCAQGVTVSVAHSDATYDEVEASLAHGFSDVTHLYSGCSTVIRRNAFRVAGVVEAGLNLDGLTVQVIADGCHLPLSLLRLIYRCKGAERMYPITDGLEFAASDIEEGATYVQENGMAVLYEDGVMKLPDRTAFAGSVATMNRVVANLIAAGIPRLDAVRMATDTPAARIGEMTKGRIAPGYDADLILFDEQVQVKLCMVGGRLLETKA